MKANIGNITSLGFARNGSFYYTEAIPSGAEVFVAALDAATGKITGAPRIASNRHVGTKGFGAYSPDGNFLAYQSGLRRGTNVKGAGGLTIQSLDTGKEYDLSTSMDYLGSLGYGGNQIVVRGGERTRGSDNTISIHEPEKQSRTWRSERVPTGKGNDLCNGMTEDGGLWSATWRQGRKPLWCPNGPAPYTRRISSARPTRSGLRFSRREAGETRLMAVAPAAAIQ